MSFLFLKRSTNKLFIMAISLGLVLTACPDKPTIPASFATLIDSGSGQASSPSFDVDLQGNAMVVWQQNDGTANRIYANRSLGSSRTWQGATVIDAGATNSTFTATSPKVALDAQGNATSVWVQILGGYSRVYANQFNATSESWGTPTLIDAGPTDAVQATLTVDAQGFATAAWIQVDPKGEEHLFSNRRNPNTGMWEGADRIDVLTSATDQFDGLNSRKPIIRSDALGNVVVLWLEYKLGNADGGWHLFINRREHTQSVWTTPKTIDSNSQTNNQPTYHQLAFDSKGNAMVVWLQEAGVVSTQLRIWANSFDIQTLIWKGAEAIDDLQPFVGRPQVAFESNGQAIAVWNRQDKIIANRFNSSNKTWDAAKIIYTKPSIDLLAPGITFNNSNQARIIWFENIRSNSVSSNDYQLSIASLANDSFLLGVPTNIQQGRFFSEQAPTLKVLPQNEFFTAFDQQDQKTTRIYAARLQ